MIWVDPPFGIRSQGEVDSTKRAALERELERGAAMDPDNGVYAIIKASLVLDAIALDEDAKDEAVTVSVLNRNRSDDQRSEEEVWRLAAGTDREVLAEGLRLLDEAVDKPYLTMHVSDRVRDRLAQLPPPRSMAEYMLRMPHEVSTLLPTLDRTRKVARVAIAEAMLRSAEGDIVGAIGGVDRVDVLSSRLAASSDTVISLLVAGAIKSEAGIARVAAFRAVGDDRQAALALAQSDAMVRFYRDVWHSSRGSAKPDRIDQTSGMLVATIYPALPGYDVDVDPFRKAEYSFVDRGVLVLGLSLLIQLSMLASLSGVWGVWRRRVAARPARGRALLLTIGVRDWVAVIGGAVLLPLLGFVAWSATPWAGRGYGLNYSWAALVWYIPAVFGVLVLLWRLAVSAMWRRAREIGLTVPVRRGWMSDAALGLALVGLACTLWRSITWEEHGADVFSLAGTVVNTVAIALAAIVATGWAACEVMWIRGVPTPWASLRRRAGMTLKVTAGLGLPSAGVVYLMADEADRVSMSVLVVCVAAGVGLIVGLIGLMCQSGRTGLFARSALRSMGPVWAATGLVLAVGVGAGLNLHERTLAEQMMVTSPTWMDREVDRSNGKLLRAYLAGDAVRPPRLR